MEVKTMSKKQGKFYSFAIKAEFYPNRNQRRYLLDNIHTSRFIYNRLVANSMTDTKINKLNRLYPIPEEYWQRNKKGNIIKKSQKRLTKLNRILAHKPSWMAELNLDSDMFNNTLLNYQAAWNMFHKVHRAGTPKFKSRNKCAWSYTTSNHYAIATLKKHGEHPTIYNGAIRFMDQHHLYAGRTLGILKLHHGMKLPTGKYVRISNVTFHMTQDYHWFVSVLFKSVSPFRKPLPKTGKVIGVDLNIENFMTDSNGIVIANPKYYRHQKIKLARAQRKLGRRTVRAKKEGRKLAESKNYQRQKRLVAQLHRQIRNQRRNFTDTLSTALIKNHDLVVTENLQSKNLLKNHALALSVSDVGWRQFISQLKYKAIMYDRVYVLVNPRYTTQICHHCRYRMGSDERSHSLTLKDRYWLCPSCRRLNIRDKNAAQNILDKGIIKYNKCPLHTANVYQ